MGKKQRSPGNTASSISLTQKELDSINARAKALGMSRSKYLVALSRADIAAGGPVVMMENYKKDAGDARDLPRQPVRYTKRPPPKSNAA